MFRFAIFMRKPLLCQIL